mgnify:CR=1 FL=1
MFVAAIRSNRVVPEGQPLKEKTKECPGGKYTNTTKECLYDNTYWRTRVPYFVSAVLAQNMITYYDKTMGKIGAIFHIAVWVAVLYLDGFLLGYEFQDTSSMLFLLQLSSLVTVGIAATLVIVLTLIQWIAACVNHVMTWNDGLLPPFLSSAIIASIRASLEFSKFLLFFAIFEPVAEVQDPNGISRKVKCYLIALICLKHYGISLTMNQHRVKVYDDNHPVSYSMN